MRYAALEIPSAKADEMRADDQTSGSNDRKTNLRPDRRIGLMEYANKYGVSISTLRRWIRAGDVDFVLSEGKYWLADERPESTEPSARASQGSLQELKQIYGSVLRERDEQILRLRDELSDLRTLVNALESENERLKRFVAP